MKKLLIVAVPLLLPGAVLAQQGGGTARGSSALLRKPATQSVGDDFLFVYAGQHALGEAGDRRVSLELKDVSVEQAAREVLKAGKVEMDLQLDEDVSKDARISLTGTNLRVATALDLVAQAGGAFWAVEKRDSRSVVRIGKKVGRPSVFSTLQWLRNGQLVQTPNLAPSPFSSVAGDVLFAQGNILERRSTFHCPHCKGTATFIRRMEQPKCPKCERLFQSQWNFCPNDGTRRPVSPSELKFCPLCGKGVEAEKTTR